MAPGSASATSHLALILLEIGLLSPSLLLKTSTFCLLFSLTLLLLLFQADLIAGNLEQPRLHCCTRVRLLPALTRTAHGRSLAAAGIAGTRMTGHSTNVPTGHLLAAQAVTGLQEGTARLVLGCRPHGALDVLDVGRAVAAHAHRESARRAVAAVAGQYAVVTAPGRPRPTARLLAFLTSRSSLSSSCCYQGSRAARRRSATGCSCSTLHGVTLKGACVIAAGQLSAALPQARAGRGSGARHVAGLVTAEARDRHRHTARRARLGDDSLRRLGQRLPRTDAVPLLVDDAHSHGRVAELGAAMAAGGQWLAAGLLARRAQAEVTAVPQRRQAATWRRLGNDVVAFQRYPARLVTLWRLRDTLGATRYRQLSRAAETLDVDG